MFPDLWTSPLRRAVAFRAFRGPLIQCALNAESQFRMFSGGCPGPVRKTNEDIYSDSGRCLRNDRRSVLKQWELDYDAALIDEMRGGLNVIGSGETREGATLFSSGKGRHGKF